MSAPDVEQVTPSSALERRRAARALGRERGREYREMMKTSVSGMEVGVGIGLGALGGVWVDRTWDTAPYGLVVGMALGLAHAVRVLWGFAKRAMDEDRANADVAKTEGGDGG